MFCNLKREKKNRCIALDVIDIIISCGKGMIFSRLKVSAIENYYKMNRKILI